MERLTAPYNFVPLNKYVYLPSWSKDVSQDIPFEDGEDGWIEVKWTNVSPLIVRDGSLKGKPNDGCPTYVETDGKKRYFIPGTSIKGMLRAVLETLSYGKMEQYNNRFFGHREFNTHQSDGKAYAQKMSSVKWGWLKKSGEKYYLFPCIGEPEKISVGEVNSKYKGYDVKVSQWDRNSFVAGGKRSQMFPTIKTGYRLYCTGKMFGKKHELLLTEGDESRKILLDEDTVEKFMTVHEPTPDFEKFTDLLDDGYSIPVSFISGNHGTDGIYAIGLSRMLRDPYKNDIKALVRKEQEPEINAESHDLCETIFGWIADSNKGKSMRGRVQMGSAFCEQDVSKLPDEVAGVLGEPKPSFYPLYLKQHGTTFKTYENADAIAGRKFYRVHKAASTIALPQGNDNDNVKTKLRPLPAGLTFAMRINVHNLRKIEIGALLSAITMHNNCDKGVYHNIGSAKSFGYGKMKCLSLSLHGLSCDADEYMKAFEIEMSGFTSKNENYDWIDSPHVNTLVNIMSEHGDEEMLMMPLNDYKDGKNNKQFNLFKKYGNEWSMLREGTKKVDSLLNEDDKMQIRKRNFREKEKQLFDEAEALWASGELEKARQVFDEIIYQERKHSIDTADEEKKIAEIEREIDKREQDKKDKMEADKKASIEEMLKSGLKAYLNEVNLNEQYKIKEGRICNERVEKWLKLSGRETLTEQEAEDYCGTLRRLMANKVKKERKDWDTFDSKLWKNIAHFIGEKKAKQLFDEGK